MSSPPRKLAEELEPIVGYTKVDKAVIAIAKEYECSTTYERYASGKHSQSIIYAEMLADFHSQISQVQAAITGGLAPFG